MMPGEWLAEKSSALKRRVNDAIRDYDDGKLTIAQAQEEVSKLVDAALTQVSDRAYADGLENAELDGDYDDDEGIEFLDEGDNDDA